MERLGNDAHPTISDVARHAGVSRATASRAMGGYGVVGSDTLERVQHSARFLGYVPNELARAMRAGSTRTLGLVIAEIGLSVFDLAARVVIDSARRQGYQVLVANTNEDTAAEKDSVRLLLEKRVDGFILVPSGVNDLDYLSERNLKGKPVTLLDRRLDSLSLPSITADNRRGAREAIDHFCELGHVRIAMIVVTSNIRGETGERPDGLVSTIHDRVDAFYSSMADHHLPVAPDWVRYCGDDQESARLAIHHILDSAEPPTAILASNSSMALAVMRVAKERGLVIGRDLSLIGFDEAPWATATTPALTVVDLPIAEMADAAVDNLIAQIARPHSTQKSVMLSPALVIRESVADLRPDFASPSAPALA